VVAREPGRSKHSGQSVFIGPSFVRYAKHGMAAKERNSDARVVRCLVYEVQVGSTIRVRLMGLARHIQNADMSPADMSGKRTSVRSPAPQSSPAGPPPLGTDPVYGSAPIVRLHKPLDVVLDLSAELGSLLVGRLRRE
jgi:hypothetical protein